MPSLKFLVFKISNKITFLGILIFIKYNNIIIYFQININKIMKLLDIKHIFISN